MDRTPSLDRSLDPSRCLDATSFIDCHSRAIRERSERIVGDADARGRAIRLFQYVRDEVSYEFRAKLGRHEYEASRVLVEGKAFAYRRPCSCARCCVPQTSRPRSFCATCEITLSQSVSSRRCARTHCSITASTRSSSTVDGSWRMPVCLRMSSRESAIDEPSSRRMATRSFRRRLSTTARTPRSFGTTACTRTFRSSRRRPHSSGPTGTLTS